jgi:hypothetical protein
MKKLKIVKKVNSGRRGVKSKAAFIYKLLVKPTGNN